MKWKDCPKCGRPAPTLACGVWRCVCGLHVGVADTTESAYTPAMRRLIAQRDAAEQALEDMKKVVECYRKQIRNMVTCYKREREAILSQHKRDIANLCDEVINPLNYLELGKKVISLIKSSVTWEFGFREAIENQDCKACQNYQDDALVCDDCQLKGHWLAMEGTASDMKEFKERREEDA